MNVNSIERKGDKAAMIHFDVGTAAWSPDYELVKTLEIGKPLPGDWILKEGNYGPQALPPRQGKAGGGGGKPAWANTEEGEKYVQERMDRRTALMQAVVVGSGITTELADKFYAWLRKGVSAPPGAAPVRDGLRAGDEPAGTGPRPAVGADTPSDGGDGTEYPRGTASGKASPSPSSTTYMEAEDGCPKCGQQWGTNVTASGKRVCLGGHVEAFD